VAEAACAVGTAASSPSAVSAAAISVLFICVSSVTVGVRASCAD
jgi:hypothetical protein